MSWMELIAFVVIFGGMILLAVIENRKRDRRLVSIALLDITIGPKTSSSNVRKSAT